MSKCMECDSEGKYAAETAEDTSGRGVCRGAEACVKCPPGTYNNKNTSYNGCLSCESPMGS
eukprot:CAMPEP_0185787982 /NCGR_PEP_ID=MMETSP1174-20130828/143633_1 /TAXON_ID=35687 /ORGANISM="Dictyocha speculum, Strain CCMP1381" /LENGTH=60 /DNA_ID=CAMNT_0028481413 /DNA_START=45 /DNA_END=224 /DNA_ORIENTATION=-